MANDNAASPTGEAKVKAAIIGLGSMGVGMALSLLRAGLDVTGFDIAPTPLQRLVEAGGHSAATPAEAASGADIVVSVVVNAAQTEAVLFGADGVAEAMPAGAVFIYRRPGGFTSTRRSRAVPPARRPAI
jgi:putative dehydrogenase